MGRLVARMRELWRRRVKPISEAWGHISGAQGFFKFLLVWVPRLISVALILAAAATYALGILILVWVFLLFGAGLVLAVGSWFVKREVHVHHVGIQTALKHEVIRPPHIRETTPKRNYSFTPGKSPTITTTSPDDQIAIKGSQIELKCSIHPKETTTVSCKVKRPDGEIDQALAMLPVGFPTIVRLIYPDAFHKEYSLDDAPPLQGGEYQVVWIATTGQGRETVIGESRFGVQ